jgi:hypothetical protein
MVQQEIDAAEKHIGGYGCEPLDPLGDHTGGNTQGNREPLKAARQEGDSRHDSPISLFLLFHPNPRACPTLSL